MVLYNSMQTTFATSVKGLRWMIKARQAWLRAMWQGTSWLEHNSELSLDVDVVGNTKTTTIKRTIGVYLKDVCVVDIPFIYTYKSSTMNLLIGTIINHENAVVSAPEYYKFDNWQTLDYVPYNHYDYNVIGLGKNKTLGLEPPTSLYTVVPTQIGSFI